MVREVDVAQILGPVRPVVRAAALLMPQAILSVHSVIHECKTLWAILWDEADTGWEEVPTASSTGLPQRDQFTSSSTGVKVQVSASQPAPVAVRCPGMVATTEFIRIIKIPGAFMSHGNGTKHSQTSIPRTNKTFETNR